MRSRPVGCLVAFAGLSYIVTVAATAFYNYRTLYLAEQDPVFWTMLLWQGITYSIWLPIGALVWRLFRKQGLVTGSVAKYVILGVVLIRCTPS